MFVRRIQREIAILAIVAYSPWLFGCAATNRFVVDPDVAASAKIEAIWSTSYDMTRFDATGGTIDLAAMTVTGTRRDGQTVTVPLAQVARFEFRGDDRARDVVKGNPAALVAGEDWRPGGRIEFIALRSGEVRDVRKTDTTLDPRGRLVKGTAADGTAFAHAFDEILYVQIRDSQPGRTVVLVAGILLVGGAIAAAIAYSEMEILGSSGGY